jgi:membrane-bound lytic murein transglycosylase B
MDGRVTQLARMCLPSFRVRIAAVAVASVIAGVAASGAPSAASSATPSVPGPVAMTASIAAPGPGPTTSAPESSAASATVDPALAPPPSPVPGPSMTSAQIAPAVAALAAQGIPVIALDAYKRAAASLTKSVPSCGIDWSLLAGIGRVESNHGRFGGAQLHADGTSIPHIIGIALDGSRSAVITDTDHGQLDGDPVYDHAVGPMQFIPGTWARWGADGNGDGRRDPFNIDDAALAAGRYLCAAGGDLRTVAGQSGAVLAYNHSAAYVAEVLELAQTYATGVTAVMTPVLAAPTSTLAPVDPGPPAAAATPSVAPKTATRPTPSPAAASTTAAGAPAADTSTPSTSAPSTSAAGTSAPSTSAAGTSASPSTASGTAGPPATCPVPAESSSPVGASSASGTSPAAAASSSAPAAASSDPASATPSGTASTAAC